MYYFDNNVKVFYDSIGEGRPLLIIHGFAIDHRAVKGTVEESIKYKNYKRIYIDLPGMGNSPAPDKMINADELLSILLKLIDKIIGTEPFSILGYSYGGYLALGLVKFIPEQVEKLILLAPVVKANAKQRNLPEKTKISSDFFEVENKTLFAQYQASAANITEQGYKNFLKEIYPGLVIGDHDFQKTFQEIGYAFKFEKRLFAKPIICDSLIILAEQDDIVGFQDTLDHEKDFYNGSFVLIKNAGHNMQLDQREFVTIEICNFLI
ncbi:alpha/beta fold hydrolase [Enterococcus rotai]|uniref:alpha/beta fold hydrolase n=1 Tax=Enterococcus rotai TaxID=118060 RepID=UPI0035C6D8AE